MIQNDWFDCIDIHIPEYEPNIQEHYSWLVNLPSRIERIANFGCCFGCEPFTLIWTLDAKEVMVVEISEIYIQELIKYKETINSRYPESLQDRIVGSIRGDMTQPIQDLQNRYFDLAYCEDVLYCLQGCPDALESGIAQMIRVVRKNGFIIAREPKYGATFETCISSFGAPITIPNTQRDTKDMSGYFVTKRLREIEIPGCPPFTYCYQKNSD